MRVVLDCRKKVTYLTLIIWGIILWGNTSYSQEKYFKLKGKVKGVDSGLTKIIFWFNDSTNKTTYTTKVNNGQFRMRGKIAHPMRVYLLLNDSLVSNDFFIEPGKQNIFFDATTRENFYQSMKITGSPVNDEFINIYQKLIQPYYDELDKCYDTFYRLNKSFTKERSASVYVEPCKRYELAIRKIDSVKKAFIVKHSTSYVSLWVLYASWAIDNLEFLAEAFNYLDNEVRKSVVGKKLAERIEVQKAFLNERIFPSMIVADSSENKVAIGELIKEKYTLIDFWFSRCGPCIVQFPTIRNLYATYKDAGFDVINISIDKRANRKDWLDAITKHQLNWKQYWDIDGKEAGRFLVDIYPTNFLLNSKGEIIKKNILPEELELFLTNNL